MKKILAAILAAALFSGGAAPLAVGAFEGSSSDMGAPFSALASVVGENASHYRLENALAVDYGTVYRFRQVEGGADVFGGLVTLSMDREGNLLSSGGRYLPVGNPVYSLSEEEAEEVAEQYGEVLSARKIVYREEGSLSAYEFSTAESERLIVSAEDGEVLLNSPRVSFASVPVTARDALGNLVTFDAECDANGRYTLADRTRNIYTYRSQLTRPYASEGKPDFDEMAVSVFTSAVKAYDFYADGTYTGARRLGLDGNSDEIAGNASSRGEIPVYLIVHYGDRFENAMFSYDGGRRAGIIYVGDGDPYGTLYRQGAAVDVIAHEYQHGITEFIAGFVYLNESGALNEAFSDIFGSLIEGHELSEEDFWTIGENGVPEGSYGLRSMKSPAYPQRVTTADMVPPCNLGGNHDNHQCDNGGVHWNSTVVSHIQSEIYEQMPAFFTRERVGKLWYATLCTLGENATFSDFAHAFLRAASDLRYPSEALGAIRSALYRSGLLMQGSEDDMKIVRFEDHDGAEIASYAVDLYGEVTPPDPPVRAADEKFTYTFTGWDREPHEWRLVRSDMVVRAQYEAALRSYPVRFYSRDGVLLSEQTVLYGSAAAPPDPPEVASDERYLYRFSGWGGDVDNITGETEFTAEYESVPKEYVVTLYSNGKEYGTLKAGYEEVVAPPEIFTSAFSFRVFDGWYLDETYAARATRVTVRGDLVLYAKWKIAPAPVLFTVAGATALLAGAGAITILILRKKKK